MGLYVPSQTGGEAVVELGGTVAHTVSEIVVLGGGKDEAAVCPSDSLSPLESSHHLSKLKLQTTNVKYYI